jgi:hypothetical protein
MQPTHNTATLAEHPPAMPAVSTDVSVDVPSILRSAARYLERYGWIQGAYYDPTATVFTPAACMVGAIGMVCYGGPVEAPAQMFDHPGFTEFEQAMLWLDAWLSVRRGTQSYEFNDAKGRTATHVTTALVAAADELDAIHGGAA